MKVLYCTLFIILSDQLSKLWVKGGSIPFTGVHFEGFQYGTGYPVLGDFLHFTYIENPGMAFGIELGGKMFFLIFSILASIGIALYLYKVREEALPFRLSLALILGGAIGNLIDRAFYGSVVDFINADFFHISVFGYHINRTVFNIADAAVTCGVILLLLSQTVLRQKEKSLSEIIAPDHSNSVS